MALSFRTWLGFFGVAALAGSLSGCWWVVAGTAGAEAGYVATQDDRTAGQTFSDQWIHAKVKAELVGSSVKSRNLGIKVRKGVVTLKGVVDTEAEKERAVSLARGVQGVTKVVDKIFVAR
ncbi:MAG: BON domain-containing protein [Elusimicrobia bacterium]|nr:BON domain-containing protein [Elusimicrobiota bacterium]